MFIFHVCLLTEDVFLFSVHSLTFWEPTFLPCSVFLRPAEVQCSSSGHKSYTCRFVLLYIIHRALGESAESNENKRRESKWYSSTGPGSKKRHFPIMIQIIKIIFTVSQAEFSAFLFQYGEETSRAVPCAWSFAYWVAVCNWRPSKDRLLCLMDVFIVISLANGT